MKLCAKTTISASMLTTVDKEYVQDFVLNSLSKEISKEVLKQMDVTEVKDINTDTITYTGTLTIPSTQWGAATISTSSYNGTSAGYSNIQEIFRVVEYTKNGKVTRVELQSFDQNSDNWVKIPRIQIEE
jgi:hypothetical protein